jgi:hypothetical protein
MKKLLAQWFEITRSITGFAVGTLLQKYDYTAKLGTP